jgi:hypothetical protein
MTSKQKQKAWDKKLRKFKLDGWKNGETDRAPGMDIDNTSTTMFSILRVEKDGKETFIGACDGYSYYRMELDSAKVALKIRRAAIPRGKPFVEENVPTTDGWDTYTVSKYRGRQYVGVGCMFIRFAEIDRIAKLLKL